MVRDSPTQLPSEPPPHPCKLSTALVRSHPSGQPWPAKKKKNTLASSLSRLRPVAIFATRRIAPKKSPTLLSSVCAGSTLTETPPAAACHACSQLQLYFSCTPGSCVFCPMQVPVSRCRPISGWHAIVSWLRAVPAFVDHIAWDMYSAAALIRGAPRWVVVRRCGRGM